MRRKYRDSKEVENDDGYFPTIHSVSALDNPRRYTPTGGAGETGAKQSQVAERASGDWSWKPGRDREMGAAFVPFTWKPWRESRWAAEAAGRFLFQLCAIGVHRAAGDYKRVRVEYAR